MGAFTDLKLDPDVARSAESDVIGNLTDAEIQALKFDIAKAQMLTDLGQELKLNITDTDDLDTIDDIVTKYEESFQQWLMYLQFCWYFREIYRFEDDQAAMRKTDYCQLYKLAKDGFSNLFTDDFRTTKGVPATRG